MTKEDNFILKLLYALGMSKRDFRCTVIKVELSLMIICFHLNGKSVHFTI